MTGRLPASPASAPAVASVKPLTTVTAIPAAPAVTALAHFEAKLAFETDCADVRAALESDAPDFLLLDVRGPGAYAAGHLPGALNLPHAGIDATALAGFPAAMLFVVYCAGPHCNGADRAAARLARLGRPVKLMLGGIEGWRDEGFGLSKGRPGGGHGGDAPPPPTRPQAGA